MVTRDKKIYFDPRPPTGALADHYNTMIQWYVESWDPAKAKHLDQHQDQDQHQD